MSSSNNNDSPKIVQEDQPVFRRAEIRGRLEQPSLVSSAPVVPAKLAPTAALRSNPVLSSKNVSSSSSSVVRNNTKAAWPAQEQLQPLPVIYMLERTHVSVADAPAREVGRRVIQCLQRESIAANCHDQEALIDAETSECVQFSIRLWQAKEKGQILVELQKAQGCSYLYCQVAKAILAAAKGEAAPKKRDFPIPSAVAKQHASSSAKNSTGSTSDANAMAKEGIEIAFSLLQKKRMDGKLMAVESLVQISKSRKHKNYAARHMLCEKQELRSTLLSMVEGKATEDAAPATPTSEMEQENARLMGRHALSVLANCLEALEQSGELASVVKGDEQLCAQTTLEALLSKVQTCDEHPHEACQAVRCIGSLSRVSDSCLQRLSQTATTGGVASSSQEVLAAAHATGGRCHAHLEQACARLPASLL